MCAKSCTAAPSNGIECTQLPAIELCTLLHGRPVCIEHSGYLVLRLHQLCLYKVSKGLNMFCVSGLAMCRYTIVVSICACPSSSLMTRMLTPLSLIHI